MAERSVMEIALEHFRPNSLFDWRVLGDWLEDEGLIFFRDRHPVEVSVLAKSLRDGTYIPLKVDKNGHGHGHGDGHGNGHGNGHGDGHGHGHGNGIGNGHGHGNGIGSGYGHGDGIGDGYG